MRDSDFKLWFQDVPTNRTKAKCKLCQKTIELSNMRTFALKNHRYKRHKDLESKKNIWYFFERKKPVSSSYKHRASDMNDMGSYVAKESIIKAEIIWVLKNVMSGFSLRSCDGISDCFKEMFLIVRLVINFHLPDNIWYCPLFCFIAT